MKKINLHGFFFILDFSLSHKILLLRKSDIIDEFPYNTDILFSSTFYIEMPTALSDITIEHGTLEDCEYLRTRCEEEFSHPINPENIFVIKSNGKKYFVGARRIEITNNNYEIGETSIGLKRN